MSKEFGFDLLLRQVLEYVESEFECSKVDAIGDTPIEKLFYYALLMKVTFGQSEYRSLFVAKDEEVFAQLTANRDLHSSLIVRPQLQLEEWRVDFAISAMHWRYLSAPPNNPSWRHLIVECDGHNFHERTKEQAARDRSRDRQAAMDGWTVFRFTGAELWRNPLACAEQVTDWVVQGWGA